MSLFEVPVLPSRMRGLYCLFTFLMFFRNFLFLRKTIRVTEKHVQIVDAHGDMAWSLLKFRFFCDECFTYWKSDCSRLHAISPSNFQCVKHSQNKIMFFKKSYAISMRNLDLGGNLFAFANRFRDPRHAQMLFAVANSFRKHFLQTPESW